MAFEQMLGVEHHEVAVGGGVDRDPRQDADAQADAHVGLDHVGVARRQRHVQRQSRGLEQRRQRGTAGETEHVGDDGILGQFLERQLAGGGQRVAARHHHGTVPAVHRQAHQMRKQFFRARGNGEVHAVARHHFGNLFGGALMQVQPHLGVLETETANHLWQHITRLGVRGRARQSAAIRLAQFRRGAPDVLHFTQNAGGAGNDFLAGRRGPRQGAALALEQLKTQFLLQQFQLTADPRLGGVQLARRGRDVEAVFMNRHEVAQLLEFHRPLFGSRRLGYKVPALPAAHRNITKPHVLMPQSSFGAGTRGHIVHKHPLPFIFETILSELSKHLQERAARSLTRLREAVAEFKKVCYANSLGAESMVLTDLIWGQDAGRHPGSALDIEIFSIDTGRLYPETYDLIERLQHRYGKTLHLYYPNAEPLEEWVGRNGINGFRDSLDQRQGCCTIRKVEPFRRAIAGHRAWVTGIRRGQSASRALASAVEWDQQYGLHKVSPLLDCSEDE